jgi:hypothetical protein
VQYTWRLRITQEERGNITPNENITDKIEAVKPIIETPNNEAPKEIINTMPDTPPCNRAFKQIEELNDLYVNNCTKVVKGNSRLKEITVGGHIDPESGVMTLNSLRPDAVTHEFAHSISFAGAAEWGFKRDDKFWNRIEDVRNNYLKALKEDRRNLISEYATNANGAKGNNTKLDEFMAEAFTLAYNHKTNKLRTTSNYNVTPESLKWANEVLSIVDEFYKRGNK